MDEVMGPVRDSNSESLSYMTLAFLEATGWYKAVYSTADPLAWGRDAGCTFVNDKCIDASGQPIDDRHFCTTPMSSPAWGCSVNRRSFG